MHIPLSHYAKLKDSNLPLIILVFFLGSHSLIHSFISFILMNSFICSTKCYWVITMCRSLNLILHDSRMKMTVWYSDTRITHLFLRHGKLPPNFGNCSRLVILYQNLFCSLAFSWTAFVCLLWIWMWLCNWAFSSGCICTTARHGPLNPFMPGLLCFSTFSWLQWQLSRQTRKLCVEYNRVFFT